MPEWVNFAEIREKVSLEDVILLYYQITTLTRQGTKLIGPCPVHNGDSPRAFHADLGRNIWHCFSHCKGGGNQLDFVAKKDGIGVREAALRLQAFFLSGDKVKAPSRPREVAPTPTRPAAPTTAAPGIVPVRHQAPADPAQTPAPAAASPSAAAIDTAPTPKGTTPDVGGSNVAPADATEANPILNVRLNLKHEHEHLTRERGLKVETLRLFDVGYCSRGIMRGTICLPIHDESGNLVAYAGRRLRPTDIASYGKYKLPKGFRKELVLYNLHRCRDVIAERGVILVEGFFSVLKLHEAGLENVVASMGCELSDHQAMLLKTAKDVVVLYDGNEAGWTGAESAKEKLEAQGVTVRLVRLPPGVEPDDLTPRAMRWLVNGVQQLDLQSLSFSVRVAAPDDDRAKK